MLVDESIFRAYHFKHYDEKIEDINVKTTYDVKTGKQTRIIFHFDDTLDYVLVSFYPSEMGNKNKYEACQLSYYVRDKLRNYGGYGIFIRRNFEVFTVELPENAKNRVNKVLRFWGLEI